MANHKSEDPVEVRSIGLRKSQWKSLEDDGENMSELIRIIVRDHLKTEKDNGLV